MLSKFFKRSFHLSLAATALAAFAAAGAFGQANQSQRHVRVDEIRDIENTDSEFKIELSVDRKDATYKIGDALVVSFKANRDCYLTLFNVDTKGKTTILFPNQYHQDNFVKAGAAYLVPAQGASFVLKADGPAGNELLKAIATLGQATLVNTKETRREGAFQSFIRPQLYVATSVQKALNALDAKKWAEAEMTIKIVE